MIWFFDWVTRFLVKRHFRHVWLKQKYTPGPESRTVYFMNHNLWWDGLLPLYLNRKLFHQSARALMEDRQMKRYSFFSRIGAFSINLEDPRAALRSLRYAVESMKRPHSCLFIYPEGELQPAGNSRPEFKKGLAWLCKQLPEADFVPVAFHTHQFRGPKPELYINIGEKEVVDLKTTSDINYQLEISLHQLLKETRKVAGNSDEGFSKI